jgi:hypothetical protein
MYTAFIKLGFRPGFLNMEDSNCFTTPGNSMDISLAAGALQLAQGPQARKGALIDITVRSPACPPTLVQAAFAPGHAAAQGEREKHRRYGGRFRPQRWVLTPFVFETYGHLGQAGRALLTAVATHVARRRGGPAAMIGQRRSAIERHLRGTLGGHLQHLLSERQLGYVMAAVTQGRHADPVSSFLVGEGIAQGVGLL